MRTDAGPRRGRGALAGFAPHAAGRASPEDALLLRELLSLHQLAISYGDVEAYLATLSEDAELHLHVGVARGHPAAAAQFEALQAAIDVRDFVTNVLVDVAGARARVRAATLVITATPPAVVLATTLIEGEARREPDGPWRFTRLVKHPDPSFDPQHGSVADRLRYLETAAARPAAG